MLELKEVGALERPQRFGSFKLVSDPPLQVVSTLGSRSDHIFLVITGTQPAHFLPALGSIEKADATSPFTDGEYVQLDDRYLVEQGRVGAFFTSPALSPMLLGFPSQQKIGGNTITFFLTIFVNAEEYAFGEAKGTNELITRFHQEHRPLVEQPPAA